MLRKKKKEVYLNNTNKHIQTNYNNNNAQKSSETIWTLFTSWCVSLSLHRRAIYHILNTSENIVGSNYCASKCKRWSAAARDTQEETTSSVLRAKLKYEVNFLLYGFSYFIFRFHFFLYSKSVKIWKQKSNKIEKIYNYTNYVWIFFSESKNQLLYFCMVISMP